MQVITTACSRVRLVTAQRMLVRQVVVLKLESDYYIVSLSGQKQPHPTIDVNVSPFFVFESSAKDSSRSAFLKGFHRTDQVFFSFFSSLGRIKIFK